MAKAKPVKGVVIKSSVPDTNGKRILVNRTGEFDPKIAKEAVARGKLRLLEDAKADAKSSNNKEEASSEAPSDDGGTSTSL